MVRRSSGREEGFLALMVLWCASKTGLLAAGKKNRKSKRGKF